MKKIILFLIIPCFMLASTLTLQAQTIDGILTGSTPKFQIQLIVSGTGTYPSDTQAEDLIFGVSVTNPSADFSLSISNDPNNLSFSVNPVTSTQFAVVNDDEFDLSNLSRDSYTTIVEIEVTQGTFGSISLFLGSVLLRGEEQFAAINSGSILPVELTSFTAHSQPDLTALLNWETATEINNDRFLVFHGTNGLDFDEIGEVKGYGSTFEPQNYSFTHNNPTAGINYYFLRQVDYDGQFEDSPIRSVKFTGVPRIDFKVFPNPGSQYLMILPPDETSSSNTTPWNVEVYDLQGKLVKSFQIRDTSYRLDIGEWPAAMYQIIARKGYTSKRIPFVKQ